MEVVRSAAARVDITEDGSSSRFAAMVDLMLTVSYIDGVFHQREREFLDHYVDSVLVMIEQSAIGSQEDRARLGAFWRKHFGEVHAKLEGEVAVLAQEVMAAGTDTYVGSRLRLRALTLFRALAPVDQALALELVNALIHADGQVTKNEHSLQTELRGLLGGAAPAATSASPVAPPNARTLVGAKPVSSLVVTPAVSKGLVALAHPLLDPMEHTLSPHPQERQAQIAWDYKLIQQAMQQWQRLRTHGTGRLDGVANIDQLPAGARFLDGHVHVMRPNEPVELVVLGDLHGCYSCLKAALLQSNFIQRAWAHQWDPKHNPDVKLVLLGDYIDRGRFSFDGVLRAVLQLFVSLPDQVIVLRGNHEWLRWYGNRIVSGVLPAEALASIAPHVPIEMLEAYRLLFEQMPTSFLFERTMFVHGGIPRDDTFATKYRDLASLNDEEIRFQMMWSDPTPTEHVPVELQRMSPRFAFGREQFKTFMKRTGMQAMIRGHEKIDSGYELFYDLEEHALVTLFSAGGNENADVPMESSYRQVAPMAMTMQAGHGRLTATPWPIQYQPFTFEPHNGLYRPQPLLEYRYD